MTKTSKIISMLAMAALFAPQFASAGENKGSIFFDGRMDFQSNMFNDDAGVVTGQRSNNETFSMQRMRVDAKGTLNDDVTSYRFRFDFLKNNAAPDATTGAQAGPQDNMSAGTNIAYVARQMGDFNLGIGKQITGIDGWVGALNTADVYNSPSTSSPAPGPMAYQDLVNEFYTTGASLTYTYGNHNLKVLVGDPSVGSVDTYTATKFANNNRNLWLARYYSTLDFGGVKIMPVVNYMAEGFQVATVGANRNNTQIAVGGRIQLPQNWEFDVDYISDTMQDKTVTGVNDTTTSIYAVARYKFASGFKPFVQYENSVQQIGVSATQNKKNTASIIGAGCEYYPDADQDFRYHLVYMSNSTAQDPGGGGTVANQNSGMVIAGVKLYTDMLKK